MSENPDYLDSSSARRLEQIDETGNLRLSGQGLTDRQLSNLLQTLLARGLHQHIVRIDLSDNALTSEGVEVLYHALCNGCATRTFPRLEVLDLSGHPWFGAAGLRHVVSLVRHNRPLLDLNLNNTGMHQDSYTELCDAIFDCNTHLIFVGTATNPYDKDRCDRSSGGRSLGSSLRRNAFLRFRCVRLNLLEAFENISYPFVLTILKMSVPECLHHLCTTAV